MMLLLLLMMMMLLHTCLFRLLGSPSFVTCLRFLRYVQVVVRQM